MTPPAVHDRGLPRGLEVLAGARDLQATLGEVLDRLEDPLPAGIADVVVREGDVVQAGVHQAVHQGRFGREHGPLGVPARVVGSRVLEVGDGDIGTRDELPEGTGVARPLRVRQIPPECRTVLAAARDVRGPAIEREVRALALDDQRLVHAPVEHDVAPGEQRPGGGRVERRGICRGRQLRGQRPVGDVPDAIDAEQRVLPPGQRPDGRPDRVGAQEGEPLPMGGHVRAQGRSILRLDQVRRIGRAVHAQFRQDRIRLRRDKLQRLVALAGPGQDGFHFLAGRAAERGTELGDGHDRDGGELRVGGWRDRFLCGCRRGGRRSCGGRAAWAAIAGRRRRGGRRASRDRWRGGAGAPTSAEQDLATGNGHHQRDGEEAQDDKQGGAFHVRESDRR